MKACATAGGGVMFIPEAVERKVPAMSYADLLKGEHSSAAPPAQKRRVFGKRRRPEAQSSDNNTAAA